MTDIVPFAEAKPYPIENDSGHNEAPLTTIFVGNAANADFIIATSTATAIPVISTETPSSAHQFTTIAPSTAQATAAHTNENAIGSDNFTAQTTKAEPAPPNIVKMKRRRKQRTVMVGVAAGVTGFIVFGPVGGVVAGTTAALAIKHIGKRKERRKMKKYEAMMQTPQVNDTQERRQHKKRRKLRFLRAHGKRNKNEVQ